MSRPASAAEDTSASNDDNDDLLETEMEQWRQRVTALRAKENYEDKV